ncbi:MAG: hypothetical protein GY765_26125, partial [bacterium]|nr:hypothetical protein [bacterium]
HHKKKKHLSNIRVYLNPGSRNETVSDALLVNKSFAGRFLILRVYNIFLPPPLIRYSRRSVRADENVYVAGFPEEVPDLDQGTHPTASLLPAKAGNSVLLLKDSTKVYQLNIGSKQPYIVGPLLGSDLSWLGMAVESPDEPGGFMVIPPAKLSAHWHGEVSNLEVSSRSTKYGRATVTMNALVADDFKNIQAVGLLAVPLQEADYRVTASHTMQPATDGSPNKKVLTSRSLVRGSPKKGYKPIANRRYYNRCTITRDGAEGTFKIFRKEGGTHQYVVQLLVTGDHGRSGYGKPRVVDIAFGEPADKEPAPSSVSTSSKASKSSYGAASSGASTSSGGSTSSGDWLGETTDPGLKKGTKLAVTFKKRSLLKKTAKSKGFEVAHLEYPQKKMLPTILWTADKKGFYMAATNGTIYQVSAPGFEIVKELNLGNKISGWGMSAKGLVVAMQERGKVAVINLRKNRLRTVMDAPGIYYIQAAPRSQMAFGTYGPYSSNKNMFAIDLKGKAKVRLLTTPKNHSGKPNSVMKNGTPYYFSDFRTAAMTSDGKYLLCFVNKKLHRFAIRGRQLVYEGCGPTLHPKNSKTVMNLSPDGKYVALFNSGKLGKDYLYYDDDEYIVVYSVTSFKYPLFMFKIRNCDHNVVEFIRNPATFFCLSFNSQLKILSSRGKLLKQCKLQERSMQVTGVLLHPSGKEILLSSREKIYWVRIKD